MSLNRTSKEWFASQEKDICATCKNKKEVVWHHAYNYFYFTCKLGSMIRQPTTGNQDRIIKCGSHESN